MPPSTDPDRRLRRWHRKFGTILIDLFTFTPWRIELEKELALSSQLLDVAIISQSGEMPTIPQAVEDLPDGLEGLRPHNLLTFKSHHEPLNAWAMDELIGHYVNYRKAVQRRDGLIPAIDFGLYAVTVRFPRDLAEQVPLRPRGPPGIFDIPWGSHHIRTVVLGDIEPSARNAFWELFSLDPNRLLHGRRHYRFRRPETKSLMDSLYWDYLLEGVGMPYTYEDVIRETRQEFLEHLTPEERQAFLDRLPAEERLRGLDPEVRLQGLDPEARVRGLDPEVRLKGLDPEVRVRGLDPEVRLRGLDPEVRLRGLDPEARLRGIEPEDRLRGLSAEELQRLRDYLNSLN